MYTVFVQFKYLFCVSFIHYSSLFMFIYSINIFLVYQKQYLCAKSRKYEARVFSSSSRSLYAKSESVEYASET